MAAIDSTRVRWAASRTSLVRADAESLNIFQTFVQQMDGKVNRYGILYGLYKAEEKIIEAHAVYEPEQIGNEYAFLEQKDPFLDTVDAVAAGLGLRRVGVVCTHPPRDNDVMLLNSRELLLCAREQSCFGDECVLLTIAKNDKEGGVLECQAWQASPQCVHLYRLGVLHERAPRRRPATGAATAAASPYNVDEEEEAEGIAQRSAHLQNPEEARLVYSEVELEVAEEKTDAAGHRHFVSKLPSHTVDTRWFTSYVAVEQFQSSIVRGLFLRRNRPAMAPPTMANLRNYMKDPKRQKDSFAEKLADFHVLVFLAETLSMSDDMPTLIEIARTRKMTPAAQNYEMLLDAYMQS
ncbi:nuclear protein localization protein 4 [Strigomonas culicis]|nr:nuclear protein localization protein 4 [Strigomonas culicis]|eukprot:EPY35569.1 nuclear protein localization protein 4 [Strigomonas culicis]